MQPLSLVLACASIVTAALNNTREYQLKTKVKPGQPDKARFANLWLSPYHTGAGTNDVVFQKGQKGSSKGSLRPARKGNEDAAG